jgi:hypothetical protein
MAAVAVRTNPPLSLPPPVPSPPTGYAPLWTSEGEVLVVLAPVEAAAVAVAVNNPSRGLLEGPFGREAPLLK